MMWRQAATAQLPPLILLKPSYKGYGFAWERTDPERISFYFDQDKHEQPILTTDVSFDTAREALKMCAIISFDKRSPHMDNLLLEARWRSHVFPPQSFGSLTISRNVLQDRKGNNLMNSSAIAFPIAQTPFCFLYHREGDGWVDTLDSLFSHMWTWWEEENQVLWLFLHADWSL